MVLILCPLTFKRIVKKCQIRLFKVNVEYHFFVYDFFFENVILNDILNDIFNDIFVIDFNFRKSMFFEMMLNFCHPVWKAVKYFWRTNLWAKIYSQLPLFHKTSPLRSRYYPSLFSNNVHCTTKGLPYLDT